MKINRVKHIVGLAAAVLLAASIMLAPTVCMAYENNESNALTKSEIAAQKALEPKNMKPLVKIDELGGLGYDNGINSVGERNESDVYSDYDSVYDPRNEEWFRGIGVKNQGNSQLCWACSLATAAEISITKNSENLSEKVREYSPVQLAYFLANRVNDPLGNTKYDVNYLYDSYGNRGNYASCGGHPILGSMSLTTWAGLADESIAPFNEYIKQSGNGDSVDESNAYNDSAILDSMNFVSNDMEEIKKYISENGSVIGCLYFDSDLFDYESGNFYYDYQGSNNPNHAVTIVGWDDNFTVNDENNNDGKSGAWIVQNSWSDRWGDKGYFYLSYASQLADMVTITATDADKYDKNYQYDGSSSIQLYGIDSGESVANIFNVNERSVYSAEVLKAVGFTTYDDYDTEYDIRIYTGITNKNNPTSGKCVSFMNDVNVGPGGYHTVELPKGVLLQGGSAYSVVITANEESYIGRENDCDYDWFECVAGVMKQQSFLYRGGKWKDLYYNGTCNRIKAFTKGVANVNLSAEYFDYDGKSHVPNVNIKMDDGTVLSNGSAYYVSSSGGKYPGSAKLTIMGKDTITGSLEYSYNIGRVLTLSESNKGLTKLTLKWQRNPNMGYLIYRSKGSGAFSKVKVINSSKQTSWRNEKLKEGTRYRYRIRSFVKIGKKTYYGNYSPIFETATNPSKSVIKKVARSNGGYFKISWKKVNCSGYKLLVSDNAKFKNAKTYTIKSSKSISKKIKPTKKSGKCYVKVRAYTSCKRGNVYGSYSSTKSFRIK